MKTLKNKVIILCITVSIIPVIFLGVFSYLRIKQLLLDREETAIKETLNSEITHLDTKLSSYVSALNTIVWSGNIKDALTKDYHSNYEMYLEYRDTIDPLFLQIRSMDQSVRSITIYTQHSINPHGSMLRPLSEAEGLPFYEQSSASGQPIFTVSSDKKSLYLTGKIDMPSNEISIVCMTIDMEAFLFSSRSLFDTDYIFYFMKDDNDVIFRYSLPENAAADIPSDRFVHEAEDLSIPGYHCEIYRPVEEIYKAVTPITLMVLIVIAICLIFILVISSWLSRILLKPLNDLTSNMKAIENGNYDIVMTTDSRDEVGTLVNTFNHLTSHLNHLINEVLRSQIEQHKKDLQILQLQINPHFLYNSLSLINSKAIIAGQTDISNMSQYLSSFYRTMLNKGRSITTVGKELENVKAYIKIQQMMHTDSFEAEFDIDESLLYCEIPNMILQPLAENAIIHGLDQKQTPGKGVITISCYSEDKYLIFRVLDNGCGMSKEKCRTVVTSDSNGYGVKNVQQRIQLFYGEEYGLKYESIEGRGTSITVKLPL
ncbi:sensor histidine kinase [Butyrivibrio sp. AC2005]|uniref:sensor histidine kinase n=1 Tax=Butyrivibrio sp. AC2005 TaxID=1280672 RepID=UPI0004084D5D|nr:sensor histidine kinase [Butyrivibrio sp. AC2005]